MKTTHAILMTLLALSSAAFAQQSPEQKLKQMSDDYYAGQKRGKEREQNAKSTAVQKITPDMCVDGICVEQDLGDVPTGANWKAPDPELNVRRLSGVQKTAYDEGVRKGREICVNANKAVWGAKASQLCEYLIFGNEKPHAELIAFFRDNKEPVCEPDNKQFKMRLSTALGDVRFEVHFSIDGRPKVREIVKEFIVVNDADKAQMRELMKQKHPYFFNEDRYPQWGGYIDYDDVFMHGRGARYQLNARSSIFAKIRTGPNEGRCAVASKSLSVQ